MAGTPGTVAPQGGPGPGPEPMVDILLATCNSSPYLAELVDSLLGQTFQNFRLLIHDDGSTDQTQTMIDAWIRQAPTRIQQIPSAAQRCGPRASFSRLLEASRAPLVMFCDHDDVWMPHKIQCTLDVMRAAIDRHGDQMPILVFTDLRIVDETLSLLHSSYWRCQRVNPRRLALRQQLTQNVPSGCTMMLNRPLADLATPIPEGAVMHDHWVSLIAAAMGRFEEVSAATLLYRQHPHNVIGVAGGSAGRLFTRARQGLGLMRSRFFRNVDQARAFLDHFRPRLDPSQIRLLEAFASLDRKSALARRATLIRHRIFKSGLLRNLASLVIV